MLKKVNAEQLDGTLKKVEFERIIVPTDRETDDNSPMVGDYEEGEVQAKEPRQQQHESIATSKPKRNTKRPARLNDTVACASSIPADDVPTTYSEAVRDSENEKWRITMSEEMSSLQKNQTWEILLTLVAQLDLELVQMDVKTAFLHGDLEEEIYMVQPEGFKVVGKAQKAVKEAIWLQGLLGELGINQKFITMYSDSQSAIHLANNQVYHARTNIDVRRWNIIAVIPQQDRYRIVCEEGSEIKAAIDDFHDEK
nr:retrovirus-related Pol polyprotein from transposon TNT 1-94 [Tanacetum cinerariifolium]